MATAAHTTYKPNDAFETSKLFSLSGFKAVVTGGGTGIGLMITQALVANGAKVYITGRRQDALDNVVQRYGPYGRIVGYVGRPAEGSEKAEGATGSRRISRSETRCSRWRGGSARRSPTESSSS